MNIKQSRDFLFKLVACFWIMALVIYAVSYNQFRYTDVTGEAPAAAAVIGEIVDGDALRQALSVPKGRITSLSIMTSTYGRDNEGTITFALEDASGEALAAQTLPLTALKDNDYTTIALPEPVAAPEDGVLTLCVSTQGCREGSAATLYFGTAYQGTMMLTTPVEASDYFTVNGQPGLGMLCVRVNTRYAQRFYLTYWIIVACAFAVAMLVGVRWWRAALRGQNNPLVALCTLVTRYDFLYRQLVIRDFKTKYKRSMLGVVWSFLNPLLTMSVQYLVFSTLFRSNIENYPVYLLTGIVFFNFFNEATTMGMTSITNNASLIKKVYVPKYIYPISRVTSSLINFLLALIPLFLVMLITGTGLHFSLLLLVFDILCLTCFTMGVSLLLTTSMTFFQDTRFLWNVISMVWMYLTPIFYPDNIIPARLLGLYRLNPLYQYVTFARTCIIGGISPQPMMYLGCMASAGIALALGVAVFKKCQDQFILYL